VCQDFAGLAIACLRANGLAASYVSGYLATDPPPGKDRMIGIDATHAWAAVWTPQEPGQFEWLGLDPTNDQMVDERYIIVGRGRDYADVPPLRGIIYTNSERSVIDVAVDVVPYSGPLEGDFLHACLPLPQVRPAPGVRDLGVPVVRQRAGVLPRADGPAGDRRGRRRRAGRLRQRRRVRAVRQSPYRQMQLAGPHPPSRRVVHVVRAHPGTAQRRRHRGAGRLRPRRGGQ